MILQERGDKVKEHIEGGRVKPILHWANQARGKLVVFM